MAECKERWKNLRAVFVRHMKPALSGSASKMRKPYYLTEAMQFTLPFIKVFKASSSNIADLPKQERDANIGDSDNEDSVAGQNLQSPGSLDPLQPPIPSPPLLPTPPPVNPQEQGMSSDTHTASKHIKKHGIRYDGADNSFVQHLEDKRAKLDATKQSNSPRSEALKMFLFSMLPDLESMNDIQVRQFKRRCLETIDDMLVSPPSLPSTAASTASLSSPPSSHIAHSSTHQSLSLPSHGFLDEQM